jgi:F0F1-type ATP synthase assembly protein I
MSHRETEVYALYLASKQRRKAWEQVSRYMTLAFLLPASVFVGYLAGYLLDRVFGTNFLYLVFLLLGIAAGFIELIRIVQKDM